MAHSLEVFLWENWYFIYICAIDILIDNMTLALELEEFLF